MTEAVPGPEVRAAIEAVLLAAVEPVEPQLLAQFARRRVLDLEIIAHRLRVALAVQIQVQDPGVRRGIAQQVGMPALFDAADQDIHC